MWAISESLSYFSNDGAMLYVNTSLDTEFRIILGGNYYIVLETKNQLEIM